MIRDTLSTLHSGRSAWASGGGTTCLLMRKIIKTVSAVPASRDKVNATTLIM